MPWLFFFLALSIPSFYGVGLLAHPAQHFTTTDFWRFWVVHLWVEDFLELFTTVLVAYIFVLLGVVHERTALRLIYLDIVLYSAGGIVGQLGWDPLPDSARPEELEQDKSLSQRRISVTPL